MKTSTVLSLCAVAALTAVLSVPSAHADQDAGHVQKITFTTVNPQGQFPNVTVDLLDKKGKNAGFVTTNCLTVNSTPLTNTCHGVYVLKGGQIAWQNATRDPRPPFVIAITGGTGKYCEARGQIRAVRTESAPEGGLYELEVITGRRCAAA